MLTVPSLKPALALSAIRFAGGAPFNGTRERAQALPLIQRLAVSAGLPDTDLPVSAARLEALTGGRSEARVFKLTRRYGPERMALGAPVAVKLAPRAQGVRERTHYEQWVRDALPAACRPELLGFCSSRAYAALCYSYAGRHGLTKADTLTRCLQRGDTAKVGLVLRKIFDPLHDSWYRPAQLRMQSDIASRYRNHYFTRAHALANTETALRACAARYFNVRQEDGHYVIGGWSFPSPRVVLFNANVKRRYHSCILHGDLNSDNLLIGEKPAGVVIVDFLKTGRGHVYEDLMHVEASVRINTPRDASFAEIWEKERLIALGRRLPGDPYAAAIRKIRDAAARYFGHVEDEANYHFAAAAIGLRLMQAVDLTHIARARITASALWATKTLAEKI